MLDRQACERRVYRLASLLTGNPTAATRVIESVVDAQPDLRKLDGPHLDRLTVLRSREIETGRLVDERVPTRIAETLADLDSQWREAWVFARVYCLPVREVAKAMDCSATATERHLERADIEFADRLGDASGEAAGCLRSFSLTLDVPGFHRVRQRRRRTRRAVVRWIVRGVVLAGLIAIGVLAWRWIPPLLEAAPPVE